MRAASGSMTATTATVTALVPIIAIMIATNQN
jgi:hypothetical protein